jgi:hypothetical protein
MVSDAMWPRRSSTAAEDYSRGEKEDRSSRRRCQVVDTVHVGNSNGTRWPWCGLGISTWDIAKKRTFPILRKWFHSFRSDRRTTVLLLPPRDRSIDTSNGPRAHSPRLTSREIQDVPVISHSEPIVTTTCSFHLKRLSLP